MHETESDLAGLQELLDRSFAGSGTHLRSIFSCDRDVSAIELSRLLTGSFVLNLAVVTRSATPLVAPVDGLFLRGRIWFGLPPGSVRGRILRSRPHVSATHTRDGEICIVVHGSAQEVNRDDPEFSAYEAYLREVYGNVVELSRARYREREGEEYNAWIDARKFFATRPDPA